MSTDFSIKPVGAPAAIAVAPPVSNATNNAVATQLPASQSVTAADPGAGARNDSPARERFRIAPGVSRSCRGRDRLSGHQ